MNFGMYIKNIYKKFWYILHDLGKYKHDRVPKSSGPVAEVVDAADLDIVVRVP